MKKTIYIFTLILTFGFLSSCSKNDDDNSSSQTLSETELKVVGKWNTSQNLTGNTYTYKSDKTAVYVNTYQGVATTYNGAWALINGNVLIEYFPDQGEAWDNNWQQNPTLKNKIEFVTDTKIKLTDFYDSTHINYHYKQ